MRQVLEHPLGGVEQNPRFCIRPRVCDTETTTQLVACLLSAELAAAAESGAVAESHTDAVAVAPQMNRYQCDR